MRLISMDLKFLEKNYNIKSIIAKIRMVSASRDYLLAIFKYKKIIL